MLGAGGLRARLDSTLGHVGPDAAKQGGGPPLPAFGQQQLAPSLGSALLGILGGEGSEDLITPANAETPAELQAPQPAPTPAPPAPQHCLLCGNLGSPSLCGPLRPAAYEGQPAAVHHLCAIWSPGCFQREVGAGARPRPWRARSWRQDMSDCRRRPRLQLPCRPSRAPLQGSSVYVNLEEEARRARQRCCATCFQTGASIVCSHPG